MTFRPKCQVLFISNRSPEEFPILNTDPAILEKITVVRYQPESIIPEDQIADLKQNLDFFVPELFNWAVSAPQKSLILQTRSKVYREFIKASGKGSERGFQEYIRTEFWYVPSKENDVIPISEILAHLELYINKSGDDSVVIDSRNKQKKEYIFKSNY